MIVGRVNMFKTNVPNTPNFTKFSLVNPSQLY